MKYSMGQNLADSGFGFLEKIHEPIFLVHRLGKIAKCNEAARKLLRITKMSMQDLDAFAKHLTSVFDASAMGFKRFRVEGSNLYLIARNMRDSDFILVEVKN